MTACRTAGRPTTTAATTAARSGPRGAGVAPGLRAELLTRAHAEDTRQRVNSQPRRLGDTDRNYVQAVSPPPRPTSPGQPPVRRPPRRARLQLRHVDPFSALRQAALWSGVGFAVWTVAVIVLYTVLAAPGVIGTVNALFGQVATAPGHRGDALISLSGVWETTALTGGTAALLTLA